MTITQNICAIKSVTLTSTWLVYNRARKLRTLKTKNQLIQAGFYVAEVGVEPTRR